MTIQEEARAIAEDYRRNVEESSDGDSQLARGIVAYVESRRYERVIEAISSRNPKALNFIQGDKRESTLRKLVSRYVGGEVSADEVIKKLRESQQSLEVALRDEGFDIEIERESERKREQTHQEKIARLENIERQVEDLRKKYNF